VATEIEQIAAANEQQAVEVDELQDLVRDLDLQGRVRQAGTGEPQRLPGRRPTRPGGRHLSSPGPV
jgi:hypothetical protein